jgi:hypothetical protein
MCSCIRMCDDDAWEARIATSQRPVHCHSAGDNSSSMAVDANSMTGMICLPGWDLSHDVIVSSLPPQPRWYRFVEATVTLASTRKLFPVLSSTSDRPVPKISPSRYSTFPSASRDPLKTARRHGLPGPKPSKQDRGPSQYAPCVSTRDLTYEIRGLQVQSTLHI